LCIERLAAQGDRLKALLEKKKQTELEHRACRHALDEAQAHLLTLKRQMKGAPEDTSRLVRWLTELGGRHREALARLERKQAEIAAIRQQYEAEGQAIVTEGEQTVDVAALEARQRELTDALSQWNEALAREEQTEARLSSDVEALDELESERETLALEVEQKKDQLSTIQSAEKYLKEAKERLSGRYLDTMQDSFGRYLGELTGEDAPVFTMDAQFRVKLRAAGLSRDTDAFSTGTRDLIALCERLSLVDAMFEGERPFLILDDPFTNLDDHTIERATALICRVAERYQVLYLTCHSGRVIAGDEVGEK
jgi:DNA repair exonuclease SbcCD ATPase subunit